MSSHVQDFPASAQVGAGLYPTSLTATTNGPAVDLAAGDGPCFAVQHVGDCPGDGTLDGKIEQSADGTSWAAVSGATFAQVDGPDAVQVIRFDRTARYVRWVGTLAGAAPEFVVAVLIGQQRKTI